MPSTLWRRTGWFLALGLVALLGTCGLVYERGYARSLAQVQQTLAIERAIDRVLSLLKDAETGQRGYVLTGRSEFLAPYSEVELALPRQLDHLSALVVGDSTQAPSANKLKQLATAKMAELAQTIALRRQERTEEALAIVKEGHGRRLMVALRAEAGSMLRHERADLAQRNEQAARALRRVLAVVACSWLLFLGAVVAGLGMAARGVAEARRATARAQASELKLREVTENATDLVRILGREAEPLYVSPSCERLLGFTPREMLAMKPRELLPEEERAVAQELTRRVQRREGVNSEPFVHRLRTKQGELRWFETSYRLVESDGAATDHLLLMSRDITERRRVEQQLQESEARLREQAALLRALSLRDELTGLYNRRGFQELAEQSLRALARGGHAACLFFADLDRLKAINDSFGHEVGDRAIATTAGILTTVFRESDVVARLGGDEFAVLALECGFGDIPSVLERITRQVEATNQAGQEFVLSLSVGTALFEPPSTTDLNHLMDQADQAMYEQKRLSKQRLA